MALRKEYKDTAVYGEFKLYLPKDKQLFVYDKIAEDGKSKLTVVINLSKKPAKASRVKKYIPSGATELISVYDEPFGDTLKPYAGKVFYTPLAK